MQASDDLVEFYHSLPPDDCALATVELRHPAFVDENSANVAIRVVCDPKPLQAKLEATAPKDAGQVVTFEPISLSVKLPDQGTTGAAKAKLEVDNVAATLIPHIEAAASSPEPVEMTFREYLSSDLTKPGLVYDGWQIKTIKASLTRVSAEAGFEDFYNTPFCPEVRLPEDYPGLDR